jgi:hypothetical protein
MRVLEWIFMRVSGRAGATESPLGWMPRYDDLEWEGLDSFTAEDFTELMGVDTEAWKQEILGHEMLFERLYDRLPKEFVLMREIDPLEPVALAGTLAPGRRAGRGLTTSDFEVVRDPLWDNIRLDQAALAVLDTRRCSAFATCASSGTPSSSIPAPPTRASSTRSVRITSRASRWRSLEERGELTRGQ